MYRKLWIPIIAIALFLLIGCEDKKSQEEVKQVKNGQNIMITEDAVSALKDNNESKENSGQFYYSYNKKKKEKSPNAEDIKTRTELDAYRDIKSPYERVQITLMIQQLSPDYRLLCSACHDDYANGVIGPALLDKSATDIFTSIMAFKNGKKENPLMKELVTRIEEQRLQAIAKEIERFNRQIKEMRSKR